MTIHSMADKYKVLTAALETKYKPRKTQYRQSGTINKF